MAEVADFVGDAAFVYAVAISFSVIAFLPSLAWRWRRNYWVVLCLFWLAWIWLYYAVFFLDNLSLAYKGVFGVFLFLFVMNWSIFFLKLLFRPRGTKP
jgi:hypothetical protein